MAESFNTFENTLLTEVYTASTASVRFSINFSVACSAIDKSEITTDYISSLTEDFVTLTDAKNVSLHGKLLCKLL